MKMKTKKFSSATPGETSYRCLEDVIGCKWSVSVLLAARDGVARPGAMEKHIQGISTKVLSERLRKLTKYGLLTQHRYAELPPRTEYELTVFGREVVALVERIRQLDDDRIDKIKTGGGPNHGQIATENNESSHSELG